MNTLPLNSNTAAFSEEQLRAGTYSLLAGMLAYPLPDDLLVRLQGIEEAPGRDDAQNFDALARAWIALKQAAAETDMGAVDDEYHALFIGVGRGELLPYASWYLTGFLMEKPLGDLRDDLALLGYERQHDVHEPEDHAAALCEVMAMLIMDSDVPTGMQRRFFAAHLASWMETFFLDLEKARNAVFYRAVGRLGYEFFRLEKRYLSMLV